MAEQLTLSLDSEISFENKPFLQGASNSEALSWIKMWPNWVNRPRALIIEGPRGSGKTHLAHIWVQRSNAIFITGADLLKMLRDETPLTSSHFFVLDDIKLSPQTEEGLFHLYNHIHLKNGGLLLTSTEPLSQHSFILTDLASRMRSVPRVVLRQPTEEMLRQFIVLHLSLSELMLMPDQMDYVMTRLDRTFQEAHTFVQYLIRLARARHARITLPLIKEALNPLS